MQRTPGAYLNYKVSFHQKEDFILKYQPYFIMQRIAYFQTIHIYAKTFSY